MNKFRRGELMMKGRWSDCYHLYRVGTQMNVNFIFIVVVIVVVVDGIVGRRKEGKFYFYSIACLLLRNRYFKIIHHHFHIMSNFLLPSSCSFFLYFSFFLIKTFSSKYLLLAWLYRSKKKSNCEWGKRVEKINKQTFHFSHSLFVEFALPFHFCLPFCLTSSCLCALAKIA